MCLILLQSRYRRRVMQTDCRGLTYIQVVLQIWNSIFFDSSKCYKGYDLGWRIRPGIQCWAWIQVEVEDTEMRGFVSISLSELWDHSSRSPHFDCKPPSWASVLRGVSCITGHLSLLPDKTYNTILLTLLFFYILVLHRSHFLLSTSVRSMNILHMDPVSHAAMHELACHYVYLM